MSDPHDRADGKRGRGPVRLIVVLLLATDGRDAPMRVLGSAAQPDRMPAPFPPDPLTEAENRVLLYLATNLSTPEIAEELFCSANTVKTHIRHVYAKLGTSSRSEAVKRARALDMLAGPRAGSPALVSCQPGCRIFSWPKQNSRP